MDEVGTDHRAMILIVDDAPANLRLLSQMLSQQGYGVRAAASGARALASIAAEPPDLILLDVRMPGMDGYEVCDRVKADAKTHDIPIIFISALDATEDKVRAFAGGGVDYITKPFQVDEVLARVRTHLALRQLQRELQEANQRMEHELRLAGRLQATFLPDTPPTIPGWQIALMLQPAGAASGDFYDIARLSRGRWGILMADVVDKGVSAAIYMVLCWSLIRTYAVDYPEHPERVLQEANRRLLATRANEFVTVFYGVLDPATGALVYANAGHCPPLVLSAGHGPVRQLARTGIPLGIDHNHEWNRAAVELAPGDALVLYTDGITEAQDRTHELLGEERLARCIEEHRGDSAQEVMSGILTCRREFVGSAPQSDDIALMVVRRDGGDG